AHDDGVVLPKGPRTGVNLARKSGGDGSDHNVRAIQKLAEISADFDMFRQPVPGKISRGHTFSPGKFGKLAVVRPQPDMVGLAAPREHHGEGRTPAPRAEDGDLFHCGPCLLKENFGSSPRARREMFPRC